MLSLEPNNFELKTILDTLFEKYGQEKGWEMIVKALFKNIDEITQEVNKNLIRQLANGEIKVCQSCGTYFIPIHKQSRCSVCTNC